MAHRRSLSEGHENECLVAADGEWHSLASTAVGAQTCGHWNHAQRSYSPLFAEMEPEKLIDKFVYRWGEEGDTYKE
jgi:hypothetical protein